MTRSWRGMLTALAIDNFGSGMFLPMTLIYLTRVAGVPLASAGLLLTCGTIAGTLMPALAARQVDRRGARTIVCAAQLLQGAGMVAYVWARGVPLALAGAVLAAAGTQLFYAALGTMTSDTAGFDGQDHAFAVVGMVRSAAFGLGGLAGGLLLSLPGSGWLTLGVLLNAASFVAAAGLLFVLVPAHGTPRPEAPSAVTDDGTTDREPAARVLADRPYLVLLVTTFLLMLGVDLFLTGMPIYAADHLHTAGWSIGAAIALTTLLGSTMSARLVKATAGLTRTACMSIGACALLAWSLIMTSLPHLPSGQPGVRTGALLSVTVVFWFGNAIIGPRLSATLAAIAPPARKGTYFAYFQYAFTAAALLAPLATGLMAWNPAAPWLINVAALLTALMSIAWLRTHLPQRALAQTSR